MGGLFERGKMARSKLENWLRWKVGMYMPLFFPRDSILFAKDYFKDKEIKAIEIGTDKGINAKSILDNLNISKMYLVDPYDEYKEYKSSEEVKTQSHLNASEKSARNRLKYYGKVIWLKQYSMTALAFLHEEEDFDYVYIDGNHEYQYVREDMEQYYKKLKVGGILAGHDIVTFPGVMKAFVEFCYEHKLKFYRITKTDWYLIKE